MTKFGMIFTSAFAFAAIAIPQIASAEACPLKEKVKRTAEYCAQKGLVPGKVYGCVPPRTNQPVTCDTKVADSHHDHGHTSYTHYHRTETAVYGRQCTYGEAYKASNGQWYCPNPPKPTYAPRVADTYVPPVTPPARVETKVASYDPNLDLQARMRQPVFGGQLEQTTLKVSNNALKGDLAQAASLPVTAGIYQLAAKSPAAPQMRQPHEPRLPDANPTPNPMPRLPDANPTPTTYPTVPQTTPTTLPPLPNGNPMPTAGL